MYKHDLDEVAGYVVTWFLIFIASATALGILYLGVVLLLSFGGFR